MKPVKIVYVLLLLLLVSCDNGVVIKTHKKESIDKEIIFFSDEENYANEVMYYDAIIDLKRKFPKEFKKFTVINSQKGKKKLKKYNVTTSPAIVVIYHDKSILNIYGDRTKEEIVKPISKTLEDLKK